MTEYIFSTADVANFSPVVWSKEIIIAAQKKLVIADSVWRFDREVLEFGKQITIPNLSNLTAGAVTLGTELNSSSNNIAENAVNISIDQWIAVPVRMSDIADAQSKYDLMKYYADKAAYAITENIDSKIAALAASLSQTVGTYATANIDDGDVLRAIQYLDDANAPQEDRSFIIGPSLKKSLMMIDKFTLAYCVGKMTQGSPVVTGQVGDLYGIPVKITTNISGYGSNAANMLIHKEALAAAIQKNVRVRTQHELRFLSTSIVADTIYGVGETRDTFGCLIKS